MLWVPGHLKNRNWIETAFRAYAEIAGWDRKTLDTCRKGYFCPVGEKMGFFSKIVSKISIHLTQGKDHLGGGKYPFLKVKTQNTVVLSFPEQSYSICFHVISPRTR